MVRLPRCDYAWGDQPNFCSFRNALFLNFLGQKKGQTALNFRTREQFDPGNVGILDSSIWAAKLNQTLYA
jgi:hypothetical protein